jgi:hypothetical protein
MYQSDIFPGESFSSSCAVSNESSNEQLQANGHIEFIEMFITDRAAEVVAKSLGVCVHTARSIRHQVARWLSQRTIVSVHGCVRQHSSVAQRATL